MLRSLILLLTFASCACAGGLPLSVEGAAAFALAHNASLSAARLRIDEARGRLLQAGRLANPEIDADYRQNVRSRENSVGIGLAQKFPLTARLRLEKAVSQAELAAAEAEVRNAERKVAADVRTIAVKLLALAGQRQLRDRQVGNSRELGNFTRRRLESGEASAADVSLVELETLQLLTELLQIEVERIALIGELRPLLGSAANDEPVITGELTAPAPPPRGGDRASRPDFIAAQNLAEAARQSAELARAQRWEDVSVGLKLETELAEDAPDGLQRDNFVGFRFSLPLPFWNNNAGRIAETTAAAARGQKEAEALALVIDAESAAARDAMSALSKVVTALDDSLLPKAAQLETQLRDAYSAGQTPLPEVLRARDRRVALERQRLDALRDYHLARVRHSAATGTILPTLKSK